MNRSTHDNWNMIAVLLIVAALGCDGGRTPEPVINLPTPSGWSRSEPRALPTDDHGFTVAYDSDIYVWTCANTFFKLRCTSGSDDVAASQAVLKPLLTSLGSACNPP